MRAGLWSFSIDDSGEHGRFGRFDRYTPQRLVLSLLKVSAYSSDGASSPNPGNENVRFSIRVMQISGPVVLK